MNTITPAIIMVSLSLFLSGCGHLGRQDYVSDHDAQNSKYWQQSRETDRQLADSDRQSKRYEALLEKWEEQARRLDLILDRQEKQLDRQEEAPGSK